MNIGITGQISEVNFGDYGMLVNNIYDIGNKRKYTFLEILEKVKNYEGIKKFLSNLGILIVNVGGYFNDLWLNWFRQNERYGMGRT
jgi:hypothetical protein